MKSFVKTLIAVSVVAASANVVAAPTQYDTLQDIGIHAARMQADNAQINAMTNRNDIATLKGQTAGQIAANASAIQQVNQQQAAVNQAQGATLNTHSAQIAGNTNAIAQVDSKADAGLSLASSALNLAASAKTDASKAQQGVNNNGAAIQQLKQNQNNFVTKPDFDASQKAQDDKATAQIAKQDKRDSGQDNAIAKNKAGYDDLENRKADKSAVKAVAAQQGVNSADIVNNHNQIVSNRSAISHNSAAIQRNSARIDRNSKDIAENRKAIKRVGAMAQAASNLHYNRNENGYAVSVGEYAGATAVAGGVQFNTSETTAITVQASYDGDQVGASVGFHGNW